MKPEGLTFILIKMRINWFKNHTHTHTQTHTHTHTHIYGQKTSSYTLRIVRDKNNDFPASQVLQMWFGTSG